MGRIFTQVGLALLLAVSFGGKSAAEGEPVTLYAFGNSLVHHLSDDATTNVPHWLNQMARADGRRFAVDGQWGFLRNFARDLPPVPNWSFRGVRGAWNPERGSFGRAGFSHILLTPANFIQYQPPSAAFEDAEGGSPVEASLAVIDWVQEAAPDARVMLYQGWADMGQIARSHPPSKRQFRRYNRFIKGDYHDWYLEWTADLRAARPGADISLIPVATVLANLFTETELAGIAPQDLYSDTAPHGTASLYLLAAMVTYSALFEAPPPADFQPPEAIHPLIRDNYADLAALIWQAVSAGRQDAALAPAAAPAPAIEQAAAPDTAPDTAPAAIPAPAEPLRTRLPVLAERLDTGLSDPALAMGLNGLADWSVQHPFIDLMKTARLWIGHRGGEWGAWDNAALVAGGHLDAQGWPVSLPDGATSLEALLLTDQPEEAVGLAGRYRLTHEGEGTLRMVGRARKVSVRDGEIWFSYTPGEGAVGVSIQETDPAGTGNHIRNIVITRESHIPLHQAGALFNPDWLRVVDDLRAVRFMDWMFTNGSPVTSWQERPLTSDYTYTWRGVPVEIMVQLANGIGADPWFSMPHMADDAYVRAFAEYTHAHLDPRLMAYVEYSNEVWNFIFPQATWAGDRARALWGRKASADGWMQYAGMRAAEVTGIWAGVYGDEAEARLKRVIAVHTGWLGLEEPLLDAPLWRKDSPDAPSPAEAFDAYAVSGYFGHELGSDEMAETLRGWMAMEAAEGFAAAARMLRDGSLAELLDVLYPYHADIAARHGLEMIMYEGGTHVAGLGEQVSDEAMTAFFTRFNYSGEMAVLYDELLSGWRSTGGTLFNAFVDVSRPSQYGSWGALRHLDDDNPRWQVLAEYNAAGAGWEGREDGAFLHGITRLGGDGADILQGSAEEDMLIAGGGDDVLVGNGGGDRLNGGDGLDIAILPGAPADYRFTSSGPRLLAAGPGGVVTLFAVELLQFTQAPGDILDVASLP